MRPRTVPTPCWIEEPNPLLERSGSDPVIGEQMLFQLERLSVNRAFFNLPPAR